MAGVLFNRSSLSFETAFKWLLYFHAVVSRQVLKDGNLFFEKFILLKSNMGHANVIVSPSFKRVHAQIQKIPSFFKKSLTYFTEVQTSLEKQLNTLGPIASRGRSIPVFLNIRFSRGV